MDLNILDCFCEMDGHVTCSPLPPHCFGMLPSNCFCLSLRHQANPAACKQLIIHLIRHAPSQPAISIWEQWDPRNRSSYLCELAFTQHRTHALQDTTCYKEGLNEGNNEERKEGSKNGREAGWKKGRKEARR